MAIQISDANPIQFWRADCDTWNESTPEGVFHKKFCQPWNCDDVVRLEFMDDLSDDSNFEAVSFSGLDTFTNIVDGETIFGPQEDWATGVNPSVTQTGSNEISKYLRSPAYSFISGRKYKATVTVTGSVDAQRPSIIIFDNDMNQQASQGIGNLLAGETKDITVIFVADENTAYIGVQSFFGTVGLPTGAVMTVNSIVVYRTIPDHYHLEIYNESDAVIKFIDFNSVLLPNQASALYTTSFTFAYQGICNEEVYLKIVKSTGTPDIEVAKSDALDVRTSHAETVLINYSNHRNFAGLYYSSVSPDQEFFIRIPAVFFKQRFPQEGEELQLSSNRVIALNSQMKVQKRLSTGKMPAYMHLKMTLILQHQTLYIDGQYWVKGGEVYEVEESKRTDPFEKYSVWLTQKEYVVRNIL